MTTTDDIEIPKRKCFVALFDILGFKDLVKTDNLDEVYKTFRGILNIKSDINEMAGHLDALLQENCISMHNYSDTFLIYTSDINNCDQKTVDKRFHALLASCDSLFISANENKLPIRGAISAGELIISEGIYIGKPIVEAYENEQQQEWIGCCISNDAINLISKDALNDHIREKAVVLYEVPCKDGDIKKVYVYNWTLSVLFKKGDYRILNKRDRHDWPTERKHRNTWDFIKFVNISE
jgi:hypothetical protein